MQRRFISIPRMILLVVLLTGIFGQPQPAKALAGLTITAITPYVTLDSNNSCSAGPRAEYIQVHVLNTSGGTLNNLSATINFPTSTPGGSYTGNWQLDAEELTGRYIGTLANGASADLFFYVNYPCEAVGGQPAPIVKNYSLTVSNGTPPDVTQNLTLTTRFEISANAGGQLYSFDIAPGAVLGQIIKMTTIYDYGNVGSGNDLGLQPAGNVSFNSGCYQLIASDITSVTGITGITAADDNLLYKTGVSSGGGTNRITVDYYFQVVCVSATATSLSPWADMVSGTQQKYTGNYTEPPACATTPCDTSAPAPTNPFGITKSVTPTNLPAGGTATYTVTVNNTSAYDAIIDKIVDVLPANVTYGALVNGVACPGANEVTTANSSSLPANGATGTLQFIANKLNTATFPPSGGYAIPANGSISLCYSVTIPNTPGTYTNSATAQSGSVSTAPATSTVTVGNPSFAIEKSGTLDMSVVAPPGRADAGDVINYSVVITNTGTLALTGVTVSDPLLANLDCDGTAGAPYVTSGINIPIGGSRTCTGSYTLTQADLDNNGGGDGDIDNTATADTNETGPQNASHAVPFAQVPALNVVKSSTTNSVTTAGQIVPYTFTVTNTGNLTLTGVTVTDPMCNSAPTRQSGDTNNDNQLQITEIWVYACNHTVTQAEVDAGGNLSNTVTAGSNQTPPDTDTHNIPVTQTPAINVVKEVSTDNVTWNDTSVTVNIGATVYYRVRVANTGNITLTGLTVDEGMAGCTLARGTDITGNNDNVFNVGEEWSYTCSVIAVAGVNDNTATADTDQTLPDTDTASYFGSSPSLNVVKSSTTTAITAAGQAVPYTFTLTNTGNITLTGVTVTDPRCDANPVRQSGDTNNDNLLQTTETWIYACTHTVTQVEVDAGGNLSNTVTADSIESAPDTDTLLIPIARTPGINIAKTPATQSVASGGTANFTLTVQNTGNITLTGVTVTDALCTTGPTLTGGDTNNDNQLQTTETWTYSCSVANVTAAFTNTASVTTTQGVTDSDTANVTLAPIPAMNVVKTSPTASVTSAGQLVPYTFTVTNTGNTTLTGVTVVDPMCDAAPAYQSGDTNSDTQLQTTETWIYTCSHTVTQAEVDAGGSLINTVTVDSTESGPDSDTHTIPVTQTPGINVVKNSTTASITSVGQSVPYTFTVTNTGNVTLTGVTVVDPMCDAAPVFQSGDTNNDGKLQTNETWLYSCSHTVTQAEINTGGNLSNTVTVDSDQSNPDNDTHLIPVIQGPALNVAKSSTATSITTAGQVVPYTFTVTNIGNVSLSGITVVDLKCDAAPAYQSGDTNNDSQLQTTEIWIYACDHTVTQTEINAGGNLTNTVTADSDQTGPDTASLNIPITQAPGINVVKSSTTNSITSVGQVVPYTFTVTNAGNVTLTGVTVTDPMCSTAPVRQSGDANNDNQLQTTETWVYVCTHTVTQAEFDQGGNLSNTVTADSVQTGPDTDTLNISMTQAPGIHIVKTPATQSVVSGGTASFTLTVTNTGNITLTGVTVTDAQCTTGPTRTGGDTNNDNQLQITETWTYSCSVANVAQDFTNTADVTTSENVTDSDSATVTVVTAPAPALNIVKEVSREANGPWNDTSISVTVGDTVYYRIRVSNTGNITLNGLTVNDGMPGCTLNRAPDITGNDDDFFEVGEEWAYTCSIPAVLGTNNNTATADTSETSPRSDSASYTATAAQVADPAISKAGDPTKASVGETVTFTLTVTNQGNIPATDVVITDALPAMFDVTAVTVTGAPLGTLVNVAPLIGTGPAPYVVTVTLGGDLGVEDVVIIRIVTTVNGLGEPPINNTASLTTSAETDVIANNADSVAITINSSTPKKKKAVLPATGFARGTRTFLPDQPSNLAYAPTDVILEIPAMGLKIPVVGVPKKNGTWNVSWLANQAGWLEGSAFPSWNGNSILTGHVYLANGLPGPFIHLSKLKYGDQIIIHANGQKYTFAVQSIAVVDATDSSVMKHEEKSWLTLVTCKDYDERTDTYRSRVVARAVLVRAEPE